MMRKSISYVVSELLSYRESPKKATKVFSKWKHNETLCPRLEEQLNRVRDGFLKYHSVAYDVQGIRDQGTDVVLRYLSEEAPSSDTAARFIAFQIKSEWDLDQEDYLKTLKSQAFEALNEYRDALDRYYIVLCAGVQEYRDEIRAVNKSLCLDSKIVVISPRYALTFFRLSGSRLTSLVDGLLREEDEVVRVAKKSIEGLRPTEAAVLITAVHEVMFHRGGRDIDLHRLSSNSFVQRVYAACPDYSRDTWDALEYEESFDPEDDDEIDLTDRKRDYADRFADDVDHLVEFAALGVPVEATSEVNIEDLRPIQALLLDGNIRYGYEDEQLLKFVFELLAVMTTFGREELDETEDPTTE
jgi:hypothetical protein